MRKKQPFSPRRVLWKLICLFLAMTLVLMLAVTAGFRHLLDQVRYTAPAAADPGLSAAQTPKEIVLDFLDPRDVNWTQLTSDLTKKNADVLNLLLVGHDSRENDAVSRADSILLCTFRKESGTLTLTSFLRDLYLPIPGHGSDRINAAYAYGGAPLLRKTLADNFDIPLDGCIEVDFSQFAKIVDTLGGVTLQLRQDEADVINRQTGSALTEGLQQLNGEETLVYSRIRKLDSDGDFSRTDRQRKVVSAIVGAYRNAGLATLMKLMKQVMPMISTDMSESRLLLLALDIFPMLPDLNLASQSIPAPGTYADKTVNGMAVLVPDMDSARELLRQTTGCD